MLRHLYWLPIVSRISFKLSKLTFKALGSGRPPYLASLLHNYSPPRTMRSSSAKPLTVPCHNFSLGSRAFRISAATTWNSLPPPGSLSPPGTRSHRMSVIVRLLLVFGTASKHAISVLPSAPSNPHAPGSYSSYLTTALCKSFTYLVTCLLFVLLSQQFLLV